MANCRQYLESEPVANARPIADVQDAALETRDDLEDDESDNDNDDDMVSPFMASATWKISWAESRL